MKQRALIILVAILGATCIVLGIFLLRGGNQPETADPTPEATATPTAAPEAVSSASEDSAVPYVSPIDFASLQKENPDIYAWLYIPGTEFDFPILQRAGDDDYYLTHDSDGNDNSMGAIFSESSYNDGKMDDPATVLYGHHMVSRAKPMHIRMFQVTVPVLVLVQWSLESLAYITASLKTIPN